MSHTKVAFLGAGSFVFGPSMLRQAIVEHRLDGLELALMDLDAEMVAGMAAAGQRMAGDLGVAINITSHTTREPALRDAAFVLYAVAPQLRRRHAMDCEIIDRFVPDHAITEFGGVAGISYSLRQMALIREVAADIRQFCPDAWLLDSANPLPRVCQAAAAAGVRTVGFCSASHNVYGMAWRLLRGAPLEYPWTPAKQTWEPTIAGLNHFNWLIALRDRVTGKDALPDLLAALRAGDSAGHPLCERFACETGYLLLPDDKHVTDFLPATGPYRRQPYHGTGNERQERIELLRQIAAGNTRWEPLLALEAWERPMDLIAALRFGKPVRFDALNLPNDGQIPNLPRGIFVETPAQADTNGVAPASVTLPGPVVGLTANAARVTDMLVRAGQARDRRLLREVVELDPTISDKPAGWQAVQACLTTHADLVGNWPGA